MPDPNASEQELELIDSSEFAYDSALEIEDEPDPGGGSRRRGSLSLKLAILAGLVLLVGGVLLAYRAHHRRKVVAAGLSQADALLRLDTAAGYRRAAALLEPIAQLDPIQGASVRAFALAMLFADYRDARLEREIDELLLAPGRAERVPSYAQLATAAVALGRAEAGTATTALARAGDGPWPLALQARVALLAGNLEAALTPAAATAADGSFAAGLAVHGDVLRRLRGDSAGARAAYEAALVASPGHPRATFGLAKLALSAQAPAAEAEPPLRRLADDRDGTPAPERARAALYLAALRMRAGDRGAGSAALDAAGLHVPAREWAERAASILADRRGPYRAVAGAPAAIQSASDDDPPELSATPPPPPPPSPARLERPAKHGPAKKAVATKRASSKRPAVSGATPSKRKTAAKTSGAKKLPSRKATSAARR